MTEEGKADLKINLKVAEEEMTIPIETEAEETVESEMEQNETVAGGIRAIKEEVLGHKFQKLHW